MFVNCYFYRLRYYFYPIFQVETIQNLFVIILINFLYFMKLKIVLYLFYQQMKFTCSFLDCFVIVFLSVILLIVYLYFNVTLILKFNEKFANFFVIFDKKKIAKYQKDQPLCFSSYCLVKIYRFMKYNWNMVHSDQYC